MTKEEMKSLFQLYHKAIIDYYNSFYAYQSKVNLKDNDKDGIEFFSLQYHKQESYLNALEKVINIFNLHKDFQIWEKQQYEKS